MQRKLYSEFDLLFDFIIATVFGQYSSTKYCFYHLCPSDLVIVSVPILWQRVILISFWYAIFNTVQLSYR